VGWTGHCDHHELTARRPSRAGRRSRTTTEDTQTLEVEAAAPREQHRPVQSAPPAQSVAACSTSIDEDPIGALGDPRGKALQAKLRELDGARGDAYVEACSDALAAADTLLALGLPDEVYRAVLVFTAHASGASALDDEARANAQASLRELCDGPMLQFTISRACVPDSPAQPSSATARAEVRAAQVLLQLGEPAVPAVLERLRLARDPQRLAQLSAVVIALGDRAVGPVSDELEAPDGLPSRAAIQLAGELQNPRLVGPLKRVLHGGDATRRNDAARSLVTIGRAASQVFIDALSAGDEELAKVATHCLGRLGHRRAVRPLLLALERSLQDKRGALTRDTMRALADIGDPRAVDALVEIASRRDWLRRSRQQDLKLAAVGTIERIPGDEAKGALRELCKAADPRVAERAREALGRRSPVDSARLA
jgi:HEAT repeat protein